MSLLVRSVRALAFVGVLLLLSQGIQSRAGTTGSIQGFVYDVNGHPIAAASVSVSAPVYSSHTVSGINGFYAVNGLPPDTYTITAAHTGFATTQYPGVTVTQDQTVRTDIRLLAEVKLLGKETIRGTTSIYQPRQTADAYTINSQSITNITGTPQNLSETAVLDALPGITTDVNGYPVIRAGAENDEGFQYDGVDATEPVSGQFINSLVLNGVSRLVLSTGGYDVTNGNTNSGVVNVVVKRGTYPGTGESTASINNPNFDHRLAFDFGQASPDNRFSYYFSFTGLRANVTYGDDKTFYSLAGGGLAYDPGNDLLTNVIYHFGGRQENELQYFADTGTNLFQLGYAQDPTILPYDSNNTLTRLLGGLGQFADPNAAVTDFAPLFPGQRTVLQNVGYPDHQTEDHNIEKINLKHQFSPSSFGEFRVTRTDSLVNFLFPWNGGALSGQFEFVHSSSRALAFDYTNQLNSQHDITLGGDTNYTLPDFAISRPLLSIQTDPLECGELCGLLGLAGSLGNPNAPQGYVQGIAALDGSSATGLPLNTLPNPASLATDPLHRNDLYIKDDFTPADRLDITFGARWDQEVIDLPSNAAALNQYYTVDSSGLYHVLNGPTVSADVTRPSQVSPRLAIAYQAGARDALRFSFGKNIEFTPLSNIENTYAVNPRLVSCNMSSGCFTPLPGFGTTNHVTNLYQQILIDLNTNSFAQYTPVRPQRAINYDLSWNHDFGQGLAARITPYYRRGYDYVAFSTPLLFKLSDGTPVFGPGREENAGINFNTGVELSIQKSATFGLSGFLSATYDNTLANYDSDFFPSVNNAAIALNHLFHVSYVAPVVATAGLSFQSHHGFHASVTIPYESGYRYGVGKHTWVFGGPNGTTPEEVLNTDLASGVGNYYFTDPSNPGTVEHPNITGSIGTADGNDPGTLKGAPQAFLNVALSQDIGSGPNRMSLGLVANNLLGNYSINTPVDSGRYHNNGLGGYAPNSGISGLIGLEPYRYRNQPSYYLNEPVGGPRTYTLFVNIKY
jgi:hypothetical protein